MTNSKALFENGYKLIPTVECLIIHKNRVLLMKRSNDSKKFPGYWIGPGGHVDEKEDYLSAAIREVKEETGVKIDDEDIKLKVVTFGNHTDRKETYIVLYFLIKLNSHQEITISDEGNAFWIPKEKVLKMKKIFPPFKYYLDHAINDKPGILYTNVELKNLKIVKVNSKKVDRDY